jgi:hypothetical protein
VVLRVRHPLFHGHAGVAHHAARYMYTLSVSGST